MSAKKRAGARGGDTATDDNRAHDPRVRKCAQVWGSGREGLASEGASQKRSINNNKIKIDVSTSRAAWGRCCVVASGGCDDG